MMDKRSLPPHAVILDLVLRWSDIIGQVGTAKVVDGTLLLYTKNHHGQVVGLNVQVNFDGESCEDPPRFVLYRLGPGYGSCRRQC
jgi:hypothetical protein